MFTSPPLTFAWLSFKLSPMNIVLIEPEIPQNAGNIVRTCSVTGAKLFLVRPLGFQLDDKHYKRAGLDYFDMANVTIVDSFDEIYNANKGKHFYFATTKASRNYAEVSYEKDCFIVFGKESFGLRESLLKQHLDDCIRIPMREGARSLNLANSVAIVLYEALRQHGFDGLAEKGHLTGRID